MADTGPSDPQAFKEAWGQMRKQEHNDAKAAGNDPTKSHPVKEVGSEFKAPTQLPVDVLKKNLKAL